MYLLPSALIDSILNKYTERVNSKSGYYKIPYESWRLLKKLASSDLIFEVETKLKNGEIHLCLTSDSLHYEIPVTYGFVNVMKERLIKMTDTNSSYPMPEKKKTALNMNFDFGPINEDEDSTFGNMDMSKLMMISMLSGNSNPFGNMFNFNLNTQNK